MHLPIIALICLVTSSAWAEQANSNHMELVYDNPLADMTYPQVRGDYLVYSQRINHRYQVMQLNKVNLYGGAKDVSPSLDKEIIRDGIALANGNIGYNNNIFGQLSPWVAKDNQHTALATGTFQELLLPLHLAASANGETWVFDSSLEATRQARIEREYTDGYLPHQLMGQSWRMYHAKFFESKSDYPKSKSGLRNKFDLPQLFTFSQGSSALSTLGDGFDASVSADGKSLVFVREDNGNFDLWQQNIDGSNLTRLTRSTFADLEPCLSGDGKRIAFISNRDAAGDILQTSIYTLEIATGKIQRITHGMDVTDGGPAWLDNQTIIFHSNRDPKAPLTETVNNWRLWTVKLPQ